MNVPSRILFPLIAAVLFCGPAAVSFSAEVPSQIKQDKPKAKSEGKMDDNAYRSMVHFLQALAVVRTAYVDAKKVSYEKLFKAALRGMLHELDPYSDYESAEIYRETQDSTNGEMSGIGVAVVYKNRTLEIVDVHADGPAAKTGLRPGDIILEIDGEPVGNRTMNELVKQLRGEAGSKVELHVYRFSNDTTKDYVVTRSVLTIPSVIGVKLADKKAGTGYLRIVQFGKKTTEE